MASRKSEEKPNRKSGSKAKEKDNKGKLTKNKAPKKDSNRLLSAAKIPLLSGVVLFVAAYGLVQLSKYGYIPSSFYYASNYMYCAVVGWMFCSFYFSLGQGKGDEEKKMQRPSGEKKLQNKNKKSVRRSRDEKESEASTKKPSREQFSIEDEEEEEEERYEEEDFTNLKEDEGFSGGLFDLTDDLYSEPEAEEPIPEEKAVAEEPIPEEETAATAEETSPEEPNQTTTVMVDLPPARPLPEQEVCVPPQRPAANPVPPAPTSIVPDVELRPQKVLVAEEDGSVKADVIYRTLKGTDGFKLSYEITDAAQKGLVLGEGFNLLQCTTIVANGTMYSRGNCSGVDVTSDMEVMCYYDVRINETNRKMEMTPLGRCDEICSVIKVPNMTKLVRTGSILHIIVKTSMDRFLLFDDLSVVLKFSTKGESA